MPANFCFRSQFFRPLLLLTLFACAATGCSAPPGADSSEPDDLYMKEMDPNEPNRITVQHCLISFKGTKEGVKRSKEEAEALAKELLERARGGEDFDAIVKEYTDDSHPGIYKMVNFGIMGNRGMLADPEDRIFERDEMVAAFGNVGFKLKVNEFGMSNFNKSSSPFGFHIIKRID
ncbi:MAG: peptidylprolyl isomerase [Planctomycetota bacterium]